MALSHIDKKKQDSINLEQIRSFGEYDISEDTIIVVANSKPIIINISNILESLDFKNIHICKEVNEGIDLFSRFLNKDMSVQIIIDHESNKNIRKAIKEILEIQSGARILIMTSKEKSDPQITKLIDYGIAGIIRKPFVLADFKEYLLYKVEKSENNQVTNTEKNSELIPSTFVQISLNKINDIFKIDETKIDAMIKNRQVIVDKEIQEAACNRCNSTNITYTSKCPTCKGINFRQQNLIEHYNCGEVYPKEGNYNTCPKCNKQIGLVGTNYREFSEYYVCSSCNDTFPRPLNEFACLGCGNIFIEKLASWKKSMNYKIQR
ncbi:MAG: hypothetical protein ACRBBZ_08555 [Nitrosopumilus sp.]